MKVLPALLTVFVSAVVSAHAQYAPSGWRPDGPNFELPQKVPQNTQEQYLPPVDPRNLARNPDQQYGPPEVDVTVHGLPTQEQVPIFQVSPINGQQYVGPNFNSDIRNLDQNLKQSQFQAQQEVYRQFARQRQLDAQANNANGRSNPKIPAQFVPRTSASPTPTTPTTAKPDELRTTQIDSTTEALNLNAGETLEDKAQPAQQKKEKVTVEVSKQNIQEYPPELFLSPLAQLKLQSQLVPLQLGQIRAPVYFQPAQGAQKQVAGSYDGETHFAALPSILAQQQLLQNQAQVAQSQQGFGQNPAYLVPNVQQNSAFIPQNDQQFLTQYQPVNQYQVASQNDQQLLSQYQPVSQYQPAVNQYETVQPQVQFPQIQAQPVAFQPQVNEIQPNYAQPKQPATTDQEDQTQFVYQQSYQPQVYQQSFLQPSQYQPQEQALISPAQVNPRDYYQQQILRQQQVGQGQEGSLQSGLDVNQQGNDIGQTDKETNDNDDDGSTATAVATAFGSRTQPRVPNTYGPPAPVPRAQTSPTSSAQDEATDDGQTVAEATAVARGSRRKSAKLRSRRVRPVFTLDRSGHLVLAQEE